MLGKHHLSTENKNFATGVKPVQTALGSNQLQKWHLSYEAKHVNPDALEDFGAFSTV